MNEVRGVSPGRWVLAAIGMIAMTSGAVLLLREEFAVLVRVALWVGGPVLVHDAVIAPAVLVLCWVGRRVLPPPSWTPLVGALIATGGLSVVALTVVGKPGALSTNPSLLDRDYTAGYLGSLAVVWGVAGAWAVWRCVRARRSALGVSPV